MNPAGGAYRLDSAARARDVLAALGQRFPVGPARSSPIQLRYVDTFDARVHRAGGRLAVVDDDGGLVLEWERERGRRSLRCPLRAVPEFARDLPAGPLRDELSALIDVRRLLPLVEVRLSCRTVPVLDRRGKTVVRVRTESGVARDARAGRRRLTAVLRVLPLRGYDAEFRRVASWAGDAAGLAPVEPCTLRRALAAVGRDPAGGHRPRVRDVERGMRCDAAMKSILRALLETMRLNEDGVRGDVDTEFLHDFRVAGRRSRSALGQVPDLFPRRTTERYRRGFAWLGELTGPVRDLDVEILRLDAHRARLPEELRAGLDAWESSLRQRHRVAHRRLVAALGSSRYRRFVASWGAYLAAPVPARSSLANAMRPVEVVARERIRRAHRRVLKRGREIDDGSPPPQFHRMRIDCKKLRYLLEFFDSLFPADGVASLVSHLKKLQDNLGEFHDFVVERAALAGFAESRPAGGRDAETCLMERLLELQVATRAAFHDRFREFAGPDATATFDELFGDGGEVAAPRAGAAPPGDGP